MSGLEETNTGGNKAGVRIRTQKTPNPNAWKFVTDHLVKRSGKVSYTDMRECSHVPLASLILRLANVTQVHLYDNVITVTQNGASDWTVLAASVEDVLQAELPIHDPDFAQSVTKSAAPREPLTGELAQIDEILERTVRPGLRADGGDLEVVELDGNILTVQYQGACGGCPSSMMGTLQAIESILRTEFNPYLEVVAI